MFDGRTPAGFGEFVSVIGGAVGGGVDVVGGTVSVTSRDGSGGG